MDLQWNKVSLLNFTFPCYGVSKPQQGSLKYLKYLKCWNINVFAKKLKFSFDESSFLGVISGQLVHFSYFSHLDFFFPKKKSNV